jgi:hypothetical protein
MINPHDLAMYPCKTLRDMPLIDILDEGGIAFTLPATVPWNACCKRSADDMDVFGRWSGG